MKKTILFLAALLTFAGMSAQSNDSLNITRYKQLLKLNRQSYDMYPSLFRVLALHLSQ